MYPESASPAVALAFIAVLAVLAFFVWREDKRRKRNTDKASVQAMRTLGYTSEEISYALDIPLNKLVHTNTYAKDLVK